MDVWDRIWRFEGCGKSSVGKSVLRDFSLFREESARAFSVSRLTEGRRTKDDGVWKRGKRGEVCLYPGGTIEGLTYSFEGFGSEFGWKENAKVDD